MWYGEMYVSFEKKVPLFLIITMILLFYSCNLDKNIENYEEYEKDSIVKITISNSVESYYFICTDKYQIVTHDNIRDRTVITDCKGFSKELLNSYLEAVSENDANIESKINVSDYYSVELEIGDKAYHFTYGLSSNPYVNMLIEMIIGSCDYKPAQEALVPFPSTFRSNQGMP